jgi:lipoprotein-anchoring transpeptidase ErfK/SrfK
MRRRGGQGINRRTLLRLAALGLVAAPALRAPTVRADDEEWIPLLIPENVRPDEHWVDVNLTEQAAVAMTGTEPMYVALATTGKDGWETPEGEFRIVRRVYNETMTSAALGIPPGPDSYHLTDVLFTQYFTWAGHALHLNYWRPDSIFGRTPTSHGCVGMRYDDAAFFWSHVGIGSRVVVHA